MNLALTCKEFFQVAENPTKYTKVDKHDKEWWSKLNHWGGECCVQSRILFLKFENRYSREEFYNTLELGHNLIIQDNNDSNNLIISLVKLVHYIQNESKWFSSSKVWTWFLYEKNKKWWTHIHSLSAVKFWINHNVVVPMNSCHWGGDYF